jgi:hypothetical protein
MNKVHRPLAMLAALAAAVGALPASARDVIVMPMPKAEPPQVKRPVRSALSRKQRRALVARVRASGKPCGSKLSRKAAEGKL